MSIISASQFRELLSSGKVRVGKKGRLAFSGDAGLISSQPKAQMEVQPKDRALKRLKMPRGKSKGILQIEQQLKYADIQFVCEYQFAQKRKFRFDLAIPDLKIGIEYEGVISEKSGHTTIKGFTKDCQKYNLAVSLGWSVYRYTALNLNELQILIKAIHEIKSGEESGEEEAEKGREERKRSKPSRRAS